MDSRSAQTEVSRFIKYTVLCGFFWLLLGGVVLQFSDLDSESRKTALIDLTGLVTLTLLNVICWAKSLAGIVQLVSHKGTGRRLPVALWVAAKVQVLVLSCVWIYIRFSHDGGPLHTTLVFGFLAWVVVPLGAAILTRRSRSK